MVTILSGSEFQSFIVLVTVFAGVDATDGIQCFAIEMSSLMQNWLKISDVEEGEMTVNGFMTYCESSVHLIFTGSKLIAIIV